MGVAVACETTGLMHILGSMKALPSGIAMKRVSYSDVGGS